MVKDDSKVPESLRNPDTDTGIRLLAEHTEKVLDFYGFNGYNAYYNPALDELRGDPLPVFTAWIARWSS